MLTQYRTIHHRRGVAAVELALVLPLILLLLAGILEMEQMLEVKQMLAIAAREGGRQASTGQMTNAQVQQVVTDYLRNAGTPIAHVQMTVQDETAPGTDASDAAQFDRFRVTVTIPFADIHLCNLRLLTDANTRLTAETVWFSAKDKPYPAPPEPPIE